MALVDVLIPTCNRTTGLAIVLAGLLGQTFADFDVIISDQSDGPDPFECRELRTLVRALRWHGHNVTCHRHLPRHGLAEQRDFLLRQSAAPYVHFIDDDVVLEPGVMARMLRVIRAEDCGFVGCPAVGLEHLDDERPHEQAHLELWEGPVAPEPFTPDSLPWLRHKVNNAATPLHLERRLARDGEPLRYKVAWVGGANVLFDRAKLLSVGGFSWWPRLPAAHAGEEVVVQFLLISRYGGCGVLPSGTYHLGLPTTVADRERN
ncbi:MAG TPA: glycosyltransferase family A protein, partial [Chloroflexaceae bacterium]|nr:glycosyltransferase family A protein [Chloroflexaceae bacterium]